MPRITVSVQSWDAFTTNDSSAARKLVSVPGWMRRFGKDQGDLRHLPANRREECVRLALQDGSGDLYRFGSQAVRHGRIDPVLDPRFDPGARQDATRHLGDLASSRPIRMSVGSAPGGQDRFITGLRKYIPTDLVEDIVVAGKSWQAWPPGRPAGPLGPSEGSRRPQALPVSCRGRRHGPGGREKHLE